MARAVFAALAVALLTLTPVTAHAAQLSSVNVQESARLPAIQPSWPIPNDRNQIFYLQRSMNSNTVVYRVNFDAAGNINPRDPADVYWRRYNTDGVVKPLKRIEHIAFGVRSKARSTPGEYTVTLRRLPQLPMLLRQTGPGQAELLATIGGKTVRAVYAYVTLEGRGLNQRVASFSVHGIDPASGRAVSETFAVKGGAIKP